LREASAWQAAAYVETTPKFFASGRRAKEVSDQRSAKQEAAAFVPQLPNQLLRTAAGA